MGWHVLLLRTSILSQDHTFHNIPESPQSYSDLVAANCVYMREVLEPVGGFDTNIRHYGGEDSGFSMKIRAGGYHLGFESLASVRHDYRESLWIMVMGRCVNVAQVVTTESGH